MTLTDITTVGGLIGLIVSVMVLAWQTRAVARQTKISNAIAGASILEASTSDLREVLKLIVERPELRAYFYEGAQAPRRRVAQARVTTVAEILGDVLETGLVANRLIPTTESLDDWISYCNQMLATSPILRRLTAENPDWWPQLAYLGGDVMDRAT